MKFQPKSMLALLAAFVMCANPLIAQTRTCRLLYPDRPQDAPKTAYLFDGTKSHRVTLPSMNLSEVIELPAGELTLAMTAVEIADAKLLPPAAPQLKIPEKVADIYIIVSTDSNRAELPIQMEWVDASDDVLQKGQTVWRNFTQDRIIAKLGVADLSLDPLNVKVSAAPAPASGYFNASFTYQIRGGGEPRPITEQSWWHDANCKHLGLVMGTEGKLPTIKFYRDFRLVSEESSKKENP
jgi:hypothetical protein